MQKKSLIITSTLLGLTASASIALADVNQPQEIIMRPMTTPASQLTVGGDLFLGFDPTTMGLDVGAAYGVSEKLEINGGYALSLKEFEAKGDLHVEGAFNIMEGNLGVAAQATLGYNLLFEGLDPLGAGARVRFRLNDQMAIVSPGNQLVVTLDPIEVAPGVDFSPIFLQIPVGFAFQASPQIYAFANTNLAVIEISDAESGFIFADFIPLSLGAFFSPSNTMDVGASLDLGDLKADEMDIGVILHARLHM
jgi:hypothetical protein